MKKKFYNWVYRLALRIIAKNIVIYGNKLTPEYLINKGWILKDGYFIEPNVKDRDLISICWDFDGAEYYSVCHTSKRIYITTETTIEWFENYYLIIHSDNGRYKLAGI